MAEPQDQVAASSDLSTFDVIMARGASSERLNRIGRLGRLSAFAHVFNATTLVGYLHDKVTGWGLWAIYAGVFLVASMLYYSAVRLRPPRNRLLSRRAVRLACVSGFIAALPWSLLSLYTTFFVPSWAHMVPFAMISGMTAGGTLILAGIPIAAFTYLATLIVPMVFASVVISANSEWMFAVSLVFYGFMLMVSAERSGRTLTQGEESERLLMQRMDDLSAAHHDNDILARSDPLTCLPNRREFHHRCGEAMKEARGCATSEAVPLFLIDLDNFKTINDTLGHDTGDLYLQEVAGRLSAALPPHWTLSRLGGDEFAVVPPAPIPLAEVAGYGEAMIAAINTTMVIGDRTLKGGCSVGVAWAPQHSEDERELFVFADDALAAIKAEGRGRLGLFDMESRARRRQRDADFSRLKDAIAGDGIVMAYQPQFDLTARTLVGFEALVRWQHPINGMAGPGYIIGLAEEKGLILDLCNAIFARVTTDVAAWRRRGLPFGQISVNVHQAHLLNAEALFTCARDLGLAAGGNRFITLEVTENSIVGRGTGNILNVLNQLEHEGFRISLDDFGTGYSSLTHINSLPIKEVKLDRSFVQGMTHKLSDYAVVKSVHDMARILGITIVAEGIETPEHEQAVRSLGSVIGQGFLYGKPMASAAAGELLLKEAGKVTPAQASA